MIRFFLYTRYTQEHGEEIDVLDPESLWNSRWNPQHPVKVIIHGECVQSPSKSELGDLIPLLQALAAAAT